METERTQPHKAHEPLPESTERVGRAVIGSAVAVHRALGPGLLESAYEICLAHELERRGNAALWQMALPVVYEAVKLEAGYRVDLMVDGVVVVEVKSVDTLAPVHEAQLLTYLRLSGRRLGFLIIFVFPFARISTQRARRSHEDHQMRPSSRQDEPHADHRQPVAVEVAGITHRHASSISTDQSSTRHIFGSSIATSNDCKLRSSQGTHAGPMR
jgi:GxxExxY protein